MELIPVGLVHIEGGRSASFLNDRAALVRRVILELFEKVRRACRNTWGSKIKDFRVLKMTGFDTKTRRCGASRAGRTF